MNIANKKSRPNRIKGICAAADKLGVTRGHLWAVLKGRRDSTPLLERYNSLPKSRPGGVKNANRERLAGTAQPKYIPPHSAAADNLSPAFFEILQKLGMEVVIVQFEARHGSVIWGFPRIEEALDQELRAVGAGMFDSVHFSATTYLIFFHVSDLAKAMGTLKDSIAKRGLLTITTIMHGESHKDLRVWYPPTAEHVETEV